MSASDQAPRAGVLRYLLALGPAVIVASVVLGPGSILTSSKVGAEYGYAMVWVLVLAAALMAGMTALGARVGVTLSGSPGDELTARLGRPAAAFIGTCVFVICASFQFSNNLGVLAALEPLLPVTETQHWSSLAIKTGVLVVSNLVVVAALYGFKHLYRPVEKLMMILVGLMLVGFASNLVLSQPDLASLARGLVPRLPAAAADTGQGNVLQDALLPLLGMFGTTFSVAGAYYQAYLVREKGWTANDLKQGFIDSLAGITVLGGISLMIMVTAAAVLHGRTAVSTLNSVTDVAAQLAPLFGNWATVLFCVGIFAGAFSSFLMNAMIGGGLMADGLGLGARMDDRYPKLFTVVALLIGMGVAIGVTRAGARPVSLIVFAQAITVVGLPPLAAAMLYLLHCSDSRRTAAHIALVVVGWCGLAAALVLAGRTLYSLAT